MADVSRSVSILFDVNDQASKKITSIKGAIKSMESLSGSVESVAAPFAKMGDAVLVADTALSALVGGAVAGAASKFADFEDVMLKVKGVMGASEEQYRELTDLVKRLGMETRYTASEAATGLQFLAMAGLDFQESMDSLPTVLQLAQAAAMDLGDTADIVTNIMAGYGIETSGLAEAADILARGFTSSNSTLRDFGDAMKYVAPVAKGMGLELSETTAVLGALQNAGIKGQMAGTALRNVLVALVAPAGNAGKLMKELGVNTEEMGIDLASSATALKSMGVHVKDANGNLRDMPDILADIVQGLEGIESPADRTAILIEIFGKRGGPQLAALLEQGSESIRELWDEIANGELTVKKLADIMESGLGGALRRVVSAWDAVGLALGEALFKHDVPGEVTGSVRALNGLSSVLRAVKTEIDSGTFDPLVDSLDGLASSLADFLDDVAADLPRAMDGVDFSGLVDALGDLAESLADLFGISTEDADDLSGALQGVVDSIEFLVRVTDGMVEAWQPFVDVLRRTVRDMREGDEETVKYAGSILGMSQAVTKLGAGLASLVLWMNDLNASAGPVFSLFVNSAAFMADSFSVAKGIIQSALLGLLTLSARVWREMLEHVEGFVDWIPGDWGSDFFDGAIQQANDFESVAAQMLDEYNLSLAESGVSARKHLGKIGQAFIDMDQAGQRATSTVKDVKNEIDTLGDAKPKLDLSGMSDPLEKLRDPVFDLLDVLEKDAWGEISVEVDESSISDLEKAISALPEEQQMWVYALVDQGKMAQAKALIAQLEAEKDVPIKPAVDQSAKDKAVAELDRDFQVKQLETQAQLDIAQIEAQADTMAAAFEAAADIAVAELGNIDSAFESIGGSLEGSTSGIQGLISDFNAMNQDINFSGGAWRMLVDQIAFEQQRQQDLHFLQKDLTRAQIDLMRARRDALQNGDSLVTVNGDGLKPHLEAFMFEILESIQVRVSEEYQSFLLGMDGAT